MRYFNSAIASIWLHKYIQIVQSTKFMAIFWQHARTYYRSTCSSNDTLSRVCRTRGLYVPLPGVSEPSRQITITINFPQKWKGEVNNKLGRVEKYVILTDVLINTSLWNKLPTNQTTLHKYYDADMSDKLSKTMSGNSILWCVLDPELHQDLVGNTATREKMQLCPKQFTCLN